jgi:hypothetical protein
MIRRALLGLVSLGLAGSALAQSTDGFGTIIRVPIVVNSSSYGSTLTLRNEGSVTANISVTFYASTGSAVGSKSCGIVNVPAGQTVEQSFAALCAMPLPGGSQFGQLHLYELNNENVPFSAYTRVQTPTGNGFSVEGFKIGTMTGTDSFSYVTGLKRQAAAPGYTSNCFIASVGEAVDVQWGLQTSAGVALGTTQNVSLAANGMVRLSDVFTAVGAPAGDYSNVTASFSEQTLGGEPGFAAFCTVQNNTSFDADFRIAKDLNPADARTRKFVSASTTGLGAGLALAAYGDQHVLGLNLQNPDWVQCAISATTPTNFEFRLKDPSGAVVVGGDSVNSFGEVYLGERSARTVGLWKLEIEGANALATFPLAYSVNCQSGNGTNNPIYLGTEADEF